jgi:hypothetical protein
LKSVGVTTYGDVVWRRSLSARPAISPLEWGIIEGENPVYELDLCAYEVRSESRVAWECSTK